MTNRETLTLVLLDNDDEIQTVMELGLKRHCFRVLPARTPAEAAQLLHHYPIEVLVADVGVLQPRPVQALQRIEEEQPRTRVMLISGYDRATVSDRYKGLLIGREFLPKPFSPLLLATVLRQMAP